MTNLLNDSRLTPALRRLSRVRGLAFGTELEYRSQLTRLNFELEAHAQRLEAELDHVEASASWKVTLPLRSLLSSVRRRRSNREGRKSAT
jgi:hypothetical protein